MLICTPGKRDPSENVGNTGTEIRYNISRNDHARAFQSQRGRADQVCMTILSTLAKAWTCKCCWRPIGRVGQMARSFRNNTFYADGRARYGHEVARNKDGTYEIAAGWGPARNVAFEGNRYIGGQIDAPSDPQGSHAKSASLPSVNWREPDFDPAHLGGFDAFLSRHRAWMMCTFTAQFGKPVRLGR